MKARVKATGKIVEVQPLYEPDEYITDKGVYYDILEIELLDEYSPDYWTRLEHQYAGMAMQGLLGNHSFFDNVDKATSGKPQDLTARIAESLAHALVEKLKESK